MQHFIPLGRNCHWHIFIHQHNFANLLKNSARWRNPFTLEQCKKPAKAYDWTNSSTNVAVPNRYGTNADLKLLCLLFIYAIQTNVKTTTEWLQAVLNNDLPIK